MRDRIRGVIIAALLASSAANAPAQRVIGRILECHDRPRVLVNTGYVAAENFQKYPGVAGRVMFTLQCYSRGFDGLEVGALTVPYHEEAMTMPTYDASKRGSGNTTAFAGLVTEQSVPGLLDNLKLVGGIGGYVSRTREMREYTYTHEGQTQTSRMDNSHRDSTLGGSLGLAFVLNASAGAALHLDVRQHILQRGGNHLIFSAGILF